MPLPDDDVPGGECGSDGCGVRDAAAPPEISRDIGTPESVCPIADRVVTLLIHESLVSQLSSLQLSHNRIPHRTP